MPGMTWDMVTSGPDAGTLIRPLQYTADEDQATRVKVWVQLATPLGKYLYDTSQGLDHERILDPLTSDEERGELVRDVVLADERVERLDDEPTVVTDFGAEVGPTVLISCTFITITGAEITVSSGLGG